MANHIDEKSQMTDLTKDQKEAVVSATRDLDSLSNNTQEAMKILILNCIENQKYFSLHQTRLPHFLEEYCIVRVGCGRQTGQTTAAIKLAHDMFKHSAFICANSSLEKQARNVFKQIFEKPSHKTYFCTPLSLAGIAGLPIEVVFVDNTSALTSEEIKNINSICRTFLNTDLEKPFVVVLIS